MTNTRLIVIAMLFGSNAALAQPAGPAEQAARSALERIRTIDPKVNAVLAVDPTAIDQAQTVDQISGGGAGSLAAVAGYPHLTVPMGLVKGLPVGLGFIGPKWSDAMILSLGYAYEQARGPVPGPKFLPSIEQSPEIAPLLARP